MTLPAPRYRLFTDAALSAGTPVELETDQAHRLRGVLRLAEGERIALFNGRDGEWAATLTRLDKRRADALPETLLRPQAAEPGPWLLFAPVKKDAMDYAVQKAVELGASALWPVRTARTNSQRVRLDRLRAQVIEAAEQCERLTVPEVFDDTPLAEVLASPAFAGSADHPGRKLFLLAERGDARPAAQAFADPGQGPAALLVGPEGGFADSDLAALAHSTFVVPVSLGPRILRAETACAAALAVWQSAAGDWHHRPPDPTC